jgi:putative lipoic acid-binding regulatory protein
MAGTYDPITSLTITSTTATITFNSLGSYTDLILVICASSNHTDNGSRGYIRFNSDSGNNYSDTWVGATGTATSSGRDTPQSAIAYGVVGNVSTQFETQIIHVMNYNNSTTYKTTLSRSNKSDGYNNGLRATVGMWRNTNAITSISLTCDGSYISGSTFALYGVKAA